MHNFILGGIAGAWLVVTPLIWTQSPAHAAISYAAGALALLLSALASTWETARWPVAAFGYGLGAGGDDHA